MGKSITLKNIPKDVSDIILKEQNRIKERKSTAVFSQELTIYSIIRKFDQCREFKNEQ